MSRRLIISTLAAIMLLHAVAFPQTATPDSSVAPQGERESLVFARHLGAGSEGATDTRADTLQPDRGFWSRHNIARLGAFAMVGGTLVYGAGVWWVHDSRPFHFWNEGWWVDANGVDKIGHMYTSYFMFRALHEMFLWGGHEPDASYWWATGVAAFHGLAIEIGDGFSDYGFDYRDVTSNYTGLAYGMLQANVPFFQNFEIKWSLYYPMNHRSFKVNDLYDYHIYWMSVRVHELLPRSLKPFRPGFLQVAFGLGTKENRTRRTYVISLDYNLEKIPIEGKDINLIKKLLNLFHLPAPGVKFSPGHAPEFQLLLLN